MTQDRFAVLFERPGLDPAFLARLRDWIREAPAPDLYRINLPARAPAWEVPLPKAVTHFLHLTKAGIMDLSWDIHCPLCNVVIERVDSLAKAGPVHHCKYCLRDVESRLDDHFEVTFTVNPAVREVQGRVRYEPSANVEVYLRAQVPPGGNETAEMEVPSGVRQLRFVAWPPLSVRVVPTGTCLGEGTVRFHATEEALLPDVLPTGQVKLRLRNDSNAPAGLLVENHDMREYAPGEAALRLGGHEVTILPAFRELFGSETLSKRESLKVREVTLVFTDILGSTALYQRAGDVTAYNLVRDHYEILFRAIQEGGGSVVKTIGDSVMASFLRPREALRALLAAHKNFQALARARAQPGEIRIRAGIHIGPAIVVTLNDRLDYFGTTVNEAARIEGTCAAGEIILSDTARAAEGMDEALANLSVETFTTPLKGLRETYRLHRVWIMESPTLKE